MKVIESEEDLMSKELYRGGRNGLCCLSMQLSAPNLQTNLQNPSQIDNKRIQNLCKIRTNAIQGSFLGSRGAVLAPGALLYKNKKLESQFISRKWTSKAGFWDRGKAGRGIKIAIFNINRRVGRPNSTPGGVPTKARKFYGT